MKIIAGLCWFSETPSWLAATVASAARVCDEIVCVDGRYMAFPSEMDFSPTQEAQTIIETAEGAGIALTLHRPSGPFWGNEVEKRNLILRLMMCNATPMEDWFLILDGDQYIVKDEPNFRHDLETTKLHVAEYGFQEYMDPLNPDSPIGVAKFRNLGSVWTTGRRGLYRYLPNLRYQDNHYTIGGDVDGKHVWLWGHKKEAPSLSLVDSLVLRHRNPLRTMERREQAAEYYRVRDLLGLEARTEATS